MPDLEEVFCESLLYDYFKLFGQPLVVFFCVGTGPAEFLKQCFYLLHKTVCVRCDLDRIALRSMGELESSWFVRPYSE